MNKIKIFSFTIILGVILLFANNVQASTKKEGIDNFPADYQPYLRELAKKTNRNHIKGALADAVVGADMFIGVSAGNLLSGEMVKTMAKEPIIFAMANPTPEIDPKLAKDSGAKIVGTGRSDYPNQINNVLAFPGVFKGALSVKAKQITEEMKMAAAKAMAEIITDEELNEEYIIPDAFDKRVVEAVSKAVADTAIKQNIARI